MRQQTITITMFTKKIALVLFLSTLAGLPSTVKAQSILGNLAKAGKEIANASGIKNNIKDVVTSLIGKKEISQNSLIGTWSYDSPVLVMESENVLNKIGGNIIASKGEQYMNKALARFGMTKGKVAITFKNDNTYTCTIGRRTVSGKYSISGSTVTLYKLNYKTLTANAKLSGNSLQLAVEADKLLTLANSLGSAVAINPSLSLLSSFMKEYNGMLVGMKFDKK